MLVLLQGPQANIEGSVRFHDGDATMHQKVECGERSLPTHDVQCCQAWHYIGSHTFPLYICVKMHSRSYLKHHINLVLLCHMTVFRVKMAVHRSVCKRIEKDGVVLPANIQSNRPETYQMTSFIACQFLSPIT